MRPKILYLGVLIFLLLFGSIKTGGRITGDQELSTKFKNTTLDIIPYGPSNNQFHSFLSELMELNKTENIEHYRNLVQNFSEQFANRTWENLNPPVQSIKNSLAVEWFREKLLNFTLNKVVPLPGLSSLIFGTYKHVIGVIPATNPTLAAILLGGHIDSVTNTTGADDNASGSMAVLEIARLLTYVDRSVDRNIIFCGFNKEEIGSYGSEEVAEYLNTSTPYNINLIINFDMLLNRNYYEPNQIDVIYDNEVEYEDGLYWGALLNTISYNYGSDIIKPLSSYDDSRWFFSDQYSFVRKNISSLLVTESNLSDIYHTPEDIWNFSDYSYSQAYEAIITTLGMLWYTEDIATSSHGFHIEIDVELEENFRFTPEKDSILAVRSWDFPSYEQSLFEIANIEGSIVSSSNYIPNNLNYWAGSIKNERYTINIRDQPFKGKLAITIGEDKNGNLLPDIWENAFEGLGPSNSDDDNDSLTNLEEFSYNLHPLIGDLDTDGWKDGIEIQLGTNPVDENDFPSPTIATTESTLDMNTSSTYGFEFSILIIIFFFLFLKQRFSKRMY
ncbi:MAG: M28 family metallopeptidase [Candidatus Hodarchaeales archaeon]|jgi:hypothetical protein